MIRILLIMTWLVVAFSAHFHRSDRIHRNGFG